MGQWKTIPLCFEYFCEVDSMKEILNNNVTLKVDVSTAGTRSYCPLIPSGRKQCLHEVGA